MTSFDIYHPFKGGVPELLFAAPLTFRFLCGRGTVNGISSSSEKWERIGGAYCVFGEVSGLRLW
jgi:hypothetical protein